nr:uncharacterized protein LOC109191529 [Ipomoea trifida]
MLRLHALTESSVPPASPLPCAAGRKAGMGLAVALLRCAWTAHTTLAIVNGRKGRNRQSHCPRFAVDERDQGRSFSSRSRGLPPMELSNVVAAPDIAVVVPCSVVVTRTTAKEVVVLISVEVGARDKARGAKRQTEGTRKSKRQAKKTKKEPVKVIVQSAPEDDLEESEQPPSGSEPDVNRGDDEESAQPSAGSEPDVNTQEVEGNEDSESNEGRDTDTEYSDATYPSLSTRATPYQLTKHLQNLTDAQSQSLREMGFDHLREHQISRVPGKLAWWLLNNFDARSCSLRVHDGKELHITEEDVALTLGFPRGNIRIEKRTKGDEDTTLLDDWKK